MGVITAQKNALMLTPEEVFRGFFLANEPSDIAFLFVNTCYNRRENCLEIGDHAMRKNLKRPIVPVVAITVLISAILIGISLYKSKHEIKREIGYYMHVEEVEQYRDTVTSYAKEHDIEDYVDVLLAIMMQESGGKGNDPMQSSESLCGQVGCIDEPEESIRQGVAYFKKTLDAANGDLKLAIQAYNFGLGFVHYALKHDGRYSEELAIQFSQEMYQKAEDPSIYSCLRKEAKAYDACYGDIYYVREVLAYRDLFAGTKKIAEHELNTSKY